MIHQRLSSDEGNLLRSTYLVPSSRQDENKRKGSSPHTQPQPQQQHLRQQEQLRQEKEKQH